ncbi:MAG: outer membrane protein OmpA-like peptidoglycan-associated protein [Parvicella sp.]|jgi:outer membrane protein OmpA-like peptidoglycan-associated protein
MKSILPTSIAILFIGFQSIAQDKSFKELFLESRIMLENEDTKTALPILLEMEKMQSKNYNTYASIGYCYLHSDFQKAEAIPYFDLVLANYKNITPSYDPKSYKEKSAPIDAIRWAGQALHFNYQFDEALVKFQEYKDVLDPKNKESSRLINRDIYITRNAMALQDDPMEINIYNLSAINSEYSEYRPKLNGDETAMYFTSRRPKSKNDAIDFEGLYFEDIFMSKKIKGVWQDPVRMDAPLNTDGHDGCMYISPDEHYMLIYRTEGSIEGSAIYESMFENGKWTEPALMIADLNSEYWETDASITPNGRTLVFTSDKPGGLGGRDIYVMNRLPNGDWANVQNIGHPINTDFDEESPYIHPDGQSIFFSSKGQNTMGGFDVFRSNLMPDGSWGVPLNVGYPINTPGQDVFYFPSNDGLRAYFSSYRKSGMGRQDIYMIELPENQLRTLALYKGNAIYSNGDTIKKVNITINEVGSTETYGEYAANDATGKFLYILPPGKAFNVRYQIADTIVNDTVLVPTKGGRFNLLKVLMLKDGQYILRDTTITIGNKPLIAIVEPTLSDSISQLTDQQVENQLNSGEKLVIDNLYFIYDKDRLINDSKPDLEKVITYMKNNPNVSILLEGHTDSNGDDDYNQNLSERRSKQVRTKLIQAGVSSSRIESKGYGETQPAENNSDPDGTNNPEVRQLNRRVEITIKK